MEIKFLRKMTEVLLTRILRDFVQHSWVGQTTDETRELQGNTGTGGREVFTEV
jgi:hypothetical protein